MNISKYFIYFLPAALVSGPLLSEFIFIFVSLNFIIFSIKKKFYSFYLNKFSYIFFLFYFFFVFTSLLSDQISISLKSSITYVRFYFFILAFIYLIKNESYFLKYFSKFLLLSLVVVSISGYLEFFFEINPFKDQKGGHRISGLFGSELIMGSYLSRLLPLYLLCTIIIDKNNLRSRNFFYVFFIYICIVFSGERVAFFFGTLSLITYYFFLGKNIFHKIFIIISVSLSVFLLLMYNPTLNARFVENTKLKMFNTTGIKIFTTEHQSHYKTAYKMFLSKPFVGYGPKSFRYKCKDEKFYEDLNSCTTHPHNFYIQLMSETGIIPPVLLFFIFLFSLLVYAKNFFTGKTDNMLIYLPIVIFTIPFLPNGNFFNNWLSMISFLSLSVSIYLIFFKKIYEKKF
jgi:O-antigen ligase